MKRNRRTYMAAAGLLVLIASASFVNAQSKDKSNPTPLNSAEISAPIYSDNLNDSYYYSFEAGPGEVAITLNVETAPGRDFLFNEVWIDLSNEAGQTLVSMHVLASKLSVSSKEAIKQQVERVTLSRRQKVMLRIFFTGDNTPGGKYQLRLSGAVKIGQDAPSEREVTGSIGDTLADGRALIALERESEVHCLRRADFPVQMSNYCVPKKGVVRIKMKDGSTKLIDLSEVEEIRFVKQ